MLPDLSVDIAGVRLKNPVLPASGTFGVGREYGRFLELARLGGMITKAVTLDPRDGNPGPRIWETPSGMLNSIGLQNPGVRAFIAGELPFLADLGVPVIVNIAGKAVDEYVEVAIRLAQQPQVSALELNLSCPNVSEGGIEFCRDPEMLSEVVAKVRDAVESPLIVKLSPNVTSIAMIAEAAASSGADAISLVNTVQGMAIDPETWMPRIAGADYSGIGGLSGPAIRPLAVRMVWEVRQAVKLPIIGMGGVSSAADAIEFLLAGANAVAVGTANFKDPTVLISVIDGLVAYCHRHRIDRLQDIVGKAKVGPGNREP